MANASVLKFPIPDARSALLLSGQGLISQNFDRAASPAGLAGTSGTIYFMAVPLLAGDVVSNISVAVAVAGAGMTLSKLGLYSTAGVLLASSADLGTAWHSQGTKTAAMAVAYTVPTSGLYYAAFLGVTGTTMPTLLRGFSNTLAVAASAIGSGLAPTGAQKGQTDLVDPATITAASGIAYWVGVS